MIVVSADRRLTASSLPAYWHAANERIVAAQHALDAAQTAMRDLQMAAVNAGLEDVLEALKRPPEQFHREPEPKVRVRVLANFSHEYAGVPVYGTRDHAIDVPVGFLKACPQLVEKIDPRTPLGRALPPKLGDK
jgi:hypothetical protein